MEASERYADKLLQSDTLSRWGREADAARDGVKREPGRQGFTPEWIAYHAVAYACTPATYSGWRMVAEQILRSENTFGSDTISELRGCFVRLLRDIFGNPFRPIIFTSDWRTDTAVSLARGMYESRDFGAMPILADALQDAGCDSDDILNHCRDEKQVHVRGCWVVDLVLGKA